MKSNQVFGELRGLLFRPSKENWEGICRLVESLPETQQREEVVPYLQHHLARWPVEICVAPERWIAPLFDEGSAPAAFALARSVSLEGCAPEQFCRVIGHDAMAHVESFGVKGVALGDRGFEALGQASHFRQLDALTLQSTEMNDEQFGALLDTGQRLGVRTFHMENNALTGNATEQLADHEIASTLEELHLDSNAIGSAGCDWLAVAPFECLKVLSLGVSGIGDTGAEYLAGSSHLSNVTRLELAQCDIGPEGVHALVNSQTWGALETLSIWSNRLGVEGVQHIARRDGMPSLQHLSMSKNNIEDDAIIALAESPLSATLKTLNVRFNEIGNPGCEALGASAYLGALESLYLSFNYCYTSGVRMLLEPMSMPRLKTLELAHTRLDDWSALEVLASQEHLEELELTYNPGLMDDRWNSYDLNFPNLRMLSLEFCSMEDHNLEKLLNELTAPNLIALFLGRNKLSQWSIQRLMNHVFERVLVLDVSNNPECDEASVEALSRRYPMMHRKQIWTTSSRIRYTHSILRDIEPPIWEMLAHEELERRSLVEQLNHL